MFLREEIKDELIRKCTLNELPYDLAKLFITQEGITSEDLFKYKYSLTDDKKFFKMVFEYLYNYVIDKIEKKNFTLISRDILSKLNCENYYLSFNTKINYIEHDYLVSKWIEDIILFMYDASNVHDFFSFITTIRSMPGINHNILKYIILNNKKLWDYDLFKLLIEDNLLDYEFIYELFIKIFTFYPKYMLDDLILEIYQYKHIFMGFVSFILSKYTYSINSKREYIIFIKYQISSRKEKAVLKYLRKEISKLIDTDVELEIFEHINDALANSMIDGNSHHKELWSTIRKFLTSDERFKERISNFTKYGTEDHYELYGDDFISDIYTHVFTLAYINDLPFLDDWKTFIRVFNLNRFYFSHARNQIRIQAKLEDVVNVYSDVVSLATDFRLFLFLYENSEQK